ncbi:MAG: hypothetical protein IPG60_04185 [Bacteroidetes bacterium]|nr:hypothetical protein [Bacteroidota bacterium]MBP7397952.1 hypothetical protein [Chitinophagales bacterium]MBK7108910.1 hypothetical protein [Bacteroidota bacterium]MBK8488764.1 hypothetical protein [Bacteroidota bacterium]MBK8681479.1 hypothetical protein [Bacteroidota bacterium]
MNNLKENISSLKSGLERLIRNHTVLKSEYEINKNQLDALRQALAEKNMQLAELQRQLNVMKTANSLSGSVETKDKTAVKQQINEFIREIDRCIELLNN